MAKKQKKRKDGRYAKKITLGVDFDTGKTVTKTVYATSVQELERKAARIIAQYERIDYNDLTVEQYVDVFIHQRKKELINDNGLNTVESYESAFELHVTPVIGKYKLVDVTSPILRELISGVKAKREGFAGQRTKQYVYTCLNLLFKRAFKDALINHNPMLAIDKPKHTPVEKGVVDISQFEQLMQMAKKEDAQMARIFEILLDSAMRRGELLALRYSDINIVNNTVTVARSVKRTRTKGLLERDPKTSKSKRSILLSDYAVSIIREQKDYSKAKAKALGVKWSESYHVFTDHIMQPVKPDKISRVFSRLRQQLGLGDNISLHSLRHTCATMLSEADVSPKKIQLRLGHASAAFTLDKYNHNTIKMQESVADTLGKIRKMVLCQMLWC